MTNIRKGGTLQLIVTVIPGDGVVTGPITYVSSNSAVAKVDADGLITGVAAGMVTITVSVPTLDGVIIKATIAIKVS